MRPFLVFAASLVIVVPRIAAAGRLQGVATDLAGNPLQGVVVERVSTGESTTSGADGSWRLAGTAGLAPWRATAMSPTGTLTNGKDGLALRFEGYRLDGKMGHAQTRSIALPSVAASRFQGSARDTVSMDWMGVTFKQPIDGDAPSMDLGATPLDTNGLGRFLIVASRYRRMDMTVLRVDMVSLEPIPRDSLVLRFHMEGTPDEMADFAMRLDLGRHYDGAGFNHPARLDATKTSRARPSPVDGSCVADGKCRWIFDIPLDPGFVFGAQSRLELHFVLDRHLLSGDSTSLLNRLPTHDPFAGSDWSFRPHRLGSMTGYPGVPVVELEPDGDPLSFLPVDPCIQLIQAGRILYGQGPRKED